MEPKYDAIIVGAGPAGSALAIELARNGLAVLLTDRQRFPRDKPCGDFVSPKGLARLDALGCGAAIRRLGSQPITASRLYLGRELLVSGTIPHVTGLPPHGHALPRKMFDEILFRHAVDTGATPLEEFEVTAVKTGTDGVEVLGTLDRMPYRACARLVVGADGANSTVARAVGLAMNDPRYVLASLRAYVDGLTLPHTLMYFDERFFPGYGWVFPVRDGLCNIGVGMVKEPMVRDGLRLRRFYDEFKSLVQRMARARGMQIEIGPHQGWPIPSYGGATRNYFQRGLLIGDAGCFVDPINGEGIPLALESARLAARTVMDCVKRDAFELNDLAGYERDWRGHFDPDLGISDLVVSMIRNRALLPAWLTLFRAMSLTARDNPAYAAVTGGILAGVVPAREGLSPTMFVRALAHSPGFWREVLRIDDRVALQDIFLRGRNWLSWQLELIQSFAGRDTASRAWLREVIEKQARVALRQGYGARQF